MEWIVENKEWIFSGVGIFFITLLLSIFFKNRSNPTPNTNSSNTNSNSNSNSNNIIINNNNNNSEENEPLKKNEKTLNIQGLKEKTNILFIDDNDFPIVNNLQNSGWNASLIHDVSDIDAPIILKSHILFVDINGVAKELSDEEGIGLVKALKNKYTTSKKIIIYSSDEEGNRFNSAFRKADDFLPKHSDYFEFLAIVEKYAGEIFNE